MHNISRKNTKNTIDAYYTRNTCVLCGNDRMESGRIFHGQCVCNLCFSHIYAMPQSMIAETSAAAEAAASYAH